MYAQQVPIYQKYAVWIIYGPKSVQWVPTTSALSVLWFHGCAVGIKTCTLSFTATDMTEQQIPIYQKHAVWMYYGLMSAQ